MDSWTSYFGPVIVHFIIGVLERGLWLVVLTRHWWPISQSTFDSQFLIHGVGYAVCAFALKWRTAYTGYMLNGL
jgi:hypothetical protein